MLLLFSVLWVLTVSLSGCHNSVEPTNPKKTPVTMGGGQAVNAEADKSQSALPGRHEVCDNDDALDLCLERLFKKFNVAPVRLADFSTHSAAKVALGKSLFFDKVLSGNNDIACASCHHPLGHTSDNLSLPAGTLGHGMVQYRRVPEFVRVTPRHAPSLYNLGHNEFSQMFWDGRVAKSEVRDHFKTPAAEKILPGLENVLAAQAMFPPTSPVEMRGLRGENLIANEVELPRVWSLLTRKVMSIAAYQQMFLAAYPSKNLDEFTFVDIANALAAFESTAFRSIESPFDKYVAGDSFALTLEQKKGAKLFYGKANCASCHSGIFQTDHKYYGIGSPQFGPGKGDGERGDEDYGRFKVTKDPSDMLKFKTPALRNVELTAPFGHTGAFADLESIVRHKLGVKKSLQSHWDYEKLSLPIDGVDAMFAPFEDAKSLEKLVEANDLTDIALDEMEIKALVAFLKSLTDANMIDMTDMIPDSVPSGLQVP